MYFCNSFLHFIHFILWSLVKRKSQGCGAGSNNTDLLRDQPNQQPIMGKKEKLPGKPRVFTNKQQDSPEVFEITKCDVSVYCTSPVFQNLPINNEEPRSSRIIPRRTNNPCTKFLKAGVALNLKHHHPKHDQKLATNNKMFFAAMQECCCKTITYQKIVCWPNASSKSLSKWSPILGVPNAGIERRSDQMVPKLQE